MGYPYRPMNRTMAALALVLGLAPAALPQSSIVSQIAGEKVATEKLYFSLKLGLNVSHLTGTVGTGRTGGFNAGLTATIRLTERWSLVPEITPFSHKGVSNIPLGTTGDPDLDPFFADLQGSDLALSYLDVPILATYRLGRLHLGAGPFVSVLSSAKERFRAELETGEELSFSRGVKDRYKSVDYGLAFEASWTITKPRRGVGLVFHVRYQAGLTDVLRTPAPSGRARNSVIQAYLSFPFVR